MGYTTGFQQLTKCDFVVSQLKDKIITGAYKRGDQIPPEPALCEMFGVSRITVREALKKLNMMGLVEIKQGRGTFVKSVDLGLFMKPLYQLIDFEEIDVEAIYSAREYIEGGTAYQAAVKRTDVEVKVLWNILQNLKASIRAEDFMQVAAFDSEFHIGVARASHNPILVACLETLEEINTVCVKRFNKYLMMLENCFQEHYAIFLAIERQDPEAARAAIVEHTLHSKAFLG